MVDATTVTETETTISCPAITFEVTNLDGTTTLDSIFTWDSSTQKLTTYSTDLTELGTPTRDLRISAYYMGGSQKAYGVSGILDF